MFTKCTDDTNPQIILSSPESLTLQTLSLYHEKKHLVWFTWQDIDSIFGTAFEFLATVLRFALPLFRLHDKKRECQVGLCELMGQRGPVPHVPSWIF